MTELGNNESSQLHNIDSQKPTLRLLEVLLSSAAEFQSGFFPPPLRRRVDAFLDKHLASYDLERIERARVTERPFLNGKFIKRQWQRKGLLGGYEAFWSTYNPRVNHSIKRVYSALGGNEKPALATVGSFLYTGFLHATSPAVLGIYAFNITQGWGPEQIGKVAGAITATYLVFGLPIAIKKVAEASKGHLPYKRDISQA